MRRVIWGTVGVALCLPIGATAAPPMRVGQCVPTKVYHITGRLEGDPPGMAVNYTNGIGQVSYFVVPGIAGSRRGDRIRLCLVSVPRNCPPGDERGRVYRATNLRTGASWTERDSSHSCGGA